jgi:integrase
MLIGALTGLRYDDLARTSWDSIRTGTNGIPYLTIKVGKIKKYQQYPVAPKALEILRKYNYIPPFPKYGTHCNKECRNELSRYPRFKEVREDFVTNEPYVISEHFGSRYLRRTFATMMYRLGMNLDTLQKYTGHTYISTLHLYVQQGDASIADYEFFKRL